MISTATQAVNYIKLYEINYIIKVMLCNIKLLSYNQIGAWCGPVLGLLLPLLLLSVCGFAPSSPRAAVPFSTLVTTSSRLNRAWSWNEIAIHGRCRLETRRIRAKSQVDRAMGMNDIHGCVPPSFALDLYFPSLRNQRAGNRV